jgi:hypothetical protein
MRDRSSREGKSGYLADTGLLCALLNIRFVVDIGGRVELIEAKWTKLPTQQDARNLDFVRDALGSPRVADVMTSRPTPGF